jgi:hypothetical protein
LGVDRDRVDLVVSVPLDQPSFRPVRLGDAHSAELMPPAGCACPPRSIPCRRGRSGTIRGAELCGSMHRG